MKFKAYILLGLLLAVLLISPTVVAKKTQDEKNSNEVQETTESDDAKEPEQYRGHCRYGCCARNVYGCGRCCRTEEATEGKYQVAGDGYGGGWGGPGGGGWGGRCQWGCCGYSRWGGCKCCYNAEEARAYLDNEVRP